jgi:hypothetical protein
MKQRTLKACAGDEETTEEAYAVIEANWPLDDMDEEELEELTCKEYTHSAMLLSICC